MSPGAKLVGFYQFLLTSWPRTVFRECGICPECSLSFRTPLASNPCDGAWFELRAPIHLIFTQNCHIGCGSNSADNVAAFATIEERRVEATDRVGIHEDSEVSYEGSGSISKSSDSPMIDETEEH